MSIAFHVSDVLQHHRCPVLFLNRSLNPQRNITQFIQMTQSPTDCLLEKLHISEYVSGYRGMDYQESITALNENKTLVNGRFEYLNLRLKVPLIIVRPEGLDLYFTSMSTYPKQEDSRYYSMHLWVLEGLGFSVHQIYTMTFNASYQRLNALDIDACFTINDVFTKDTGKVIGNILSQIKSRKYDISEDLAEMQAILDLKKAHPTIETCPLLTRCNYFKTCFAQETYESANSVLYLTQSKEKRTFLKEGIYTMDKIPLDRIEGSAQQYAQIMAVREGGLYVQQYALKQWLNELDLDHLNFLDFEWDTYGLPPFTNMKPFDPVCFQYSLHTYHDGNLNHYEFLETGDTRLSFIKSLLSQVPKDGPIIAYNAFGAETIRLKELAFQFPAYRKELLALVERFVDLEEVFDLGLVYDVRMKGLYSLKSIIQVVDPTMNYDQLSISHGMDAVMHYRNYAKQDEDEETMDALLKYCRMDTLAMVEIIKWLMNLAGETYA